MARSLFAPALLACTALASSGCTALDRLSAPSLKSTPDATGMVVVEPDITIYAALFGIRSSASAAGGLLARVDGTAQVAHGTASSSYVIFPDLAPGKWQIASLEGKVQSGTSSTTWGYDIPSDSAAALTVDVKAGEAVYIGVKIDDDRHPSTWGVRCTRHDDPTAERKAWSWMDDIYEKTVWEPVFRSKTVASDVKAEPAAAPKSGG